MLLTYSIILLFWNLLCFSIVLYGLVTVTCDCVICHVIGM